MRYSRRQLFVIQQSSLCVSVTYMFCESYLLLFVKLHKHLKPPACQSWSHYRLCAPPCPHYISSGIHTVCASSDWEWSMQSRLSRGATARIFEWLPLRMLRSRGENSLWGGSFHQRSSVERWLCSWESQMDQMEGMKTGEPLSSSFPFRSSAHSLRSEARPAVLPPGERARCSACLFLRRGTGRTSMSFHKK